MFMTEQKKEGKKILGIQRNIFFVGITSFLTDTTTKMIYSIMPLFLMSLGASKTEVSLIEGMAESTASILKALSGWWSDKIGRNKPLMIIGYGFTALLSPIFAFAASPLQVLIIRVTERIGKGIRTAPRDSLVAGSSEDNTKGRNFGFHKAMDNSGAILGPLIAFGILTFFPKDYRMVLLIAGIPGLFGLITIIGFVKEAKRKKQDLLGKISVKDFSKQFYFLLIIVFIFTLGNSTDALLLIKAGDVGISNEFIPMMYLIFNSVSVLLAVPAGVFSDKIGRERLIIFGYVIYALIYFGFGRTSSPVIVILLFAFYGVYSALTDGVQKALVSDLIDKNKRGTGLGIYNCLVGMTLLPASVIAGLLYDHINNRAPFYFGAILAVIAALLMLIFFNTNKKKLISNDN
jgi:MFS family permease